MSTSLRARRRPAALSALLIVVALAVSSCGGQTAQPGSENPSGAGGQAGAGAGGTPARSQVDEPIVFAGLDWDSVAVHNAIARHIIEKGYGYKTDEIPGSTIPMLQGMIKGDIDVTMEIWYENIKEAWDKAAQAGDVIDLGVNFPDAIQGFFVPTYVIKGDAARGIQPLAPDLKSVQDLPRYAHLFKDPEEPGKGRFYDCIAGWSCEKVNAKKFEAYGLNATFNRFLPGTGEALATSIAAAYTKGDPWVGYYWGPTWILGKYDMTMLEEPAPYSKECWDTTQVCGYPVVKVTVGVHKDFHRQAPDLIEFLTNYETSQKLVSELLAYMQDNKADAKGAALHFLKTKQDVWTKWVPADVADRVKRSLAS